MEHMNRNPGSPGERHIGKTGTAAGLGAAFVTLVAVACCAGIPAFLSFVGAIGLGVLLKKHLLFPLMVASLLLGTWGAWRSYKLHQNPLVLGGYLACAGSIPLGMKLWHPLMYAGLVLLLLLTGADLVRSLKGPAVCAKRRDEEAPGNPGIGAS